MGTAHVQDEEAIAIRVQNYTLLVAEDETLIRMSQCEFLREYGFITLEAADLGEAKTILEVVAVDLVISNIRMDGHFDGIELARFVPKSRRYR